MRLREIWLLGERQAARLGGQARARLGPRGLARTLRRQVRQALGLAALRLVRPEHVLFAAAGEERLELLALDRLALEQQLGDRLQLAAMLGEDVLGLLVRRLDDPADLVVDLARDLVRVVGLG